MRRPDCPRFASLPRPRVPPWGSRAQPTVGFGAGKAPFGARGGAPRLCAHPPSTGTDPEGRSAALRDGWATRPWGSSGLNASVTVAPYLTHTPSTLTTAHTHTRTAGRAHVTHPNRRLFLPRPPHYSPQRAPRRACAFVASACGREVAAPPGAAPGAPYVRGAEPCRAVPSRARPPTAPLLLPLLSSPMPHCPLLQHRPRAVPCPGPSPPKVPQIVRLIPPINRTLPG